MQQAGAVVSAAAAGAAKLLAVNSLPQQLFETLAASKACDHFASSAQTATPPDQQGIATVSRPSEQKRPRNTRRLPMSSRT